MERFYFTCKGAAFLLNVLGQVGGKDLNHGLAGQLVHGVVLVVAPGQVSEHVPGQLVDPLDHLGHVGLEVGGGEHVLQLGQLLVRDLPLPLQLALPLRNEVPVVGGVQPFTKWLIEACTSNLEITFWSTETYYSF